MKRNSSPEQNDTKAWRGTQAMDGGTFMNQGIHFVDAMRFGGGDIIEVKSTLATLARNMECGDIRSAPFRFESGALGKISGTCINSIDIWDFDDADPEMDAKAKDADYQSKSVYGFGHSAEHVKIFQSLRTHRLGSPAKADIVTLDVILKIYCKL